MRKQIFAIFMVFIMVASVLGCSSNESGNNISKNTETQSGQSEESSQISEMPKEKVTIRVPDEIVVTEELLETSLEAFQLKKQAEFDELYGDYITVEHVPAEYISTYEEYAAMMAGNSCPAYLLVSSTIYMRDLYAQGLAADITDFVIDNEYFNQNYEGVIESVKYGDRIVGYPNSVELPLMGWRNDALTAAGYDPATFTCETWDEYYEIVKNIHTDDMNGASLYAAEFFLWPQNWLCSNGAEVAIQNEDGTISLNYTDEKVVETVEFLKKIYQEGLTNEDIGFSDMGQVFTLINNAEVASWTMYPSWMILIANSNLEEEDITMTLYPKGPSGEYNPRYYVSAVVFPASLSDAELEATLLYYSFFHSQDYYMEFYDFAEANGHTYMGIPAVKDVPFEKGLTDIPDQWIEKMKELMEVGSDDISLKSTAYSTYISAMLPSIISNPDMDVVEGLKEAEELTMNEWLNDYNENVTK